MAPLTASITIRLAHAQDAVAVAQLSILDSRRPPAGPVLLAEVDGEPWAAVSLDDHEAVADPFRPSGPVVDLLREHARRLSRAEDRRFQRRGLAQALRLRLA